MEIEDWKLKIGNWEDACSNGIAIGDLQSPISNFQFPISNLRFDALRRQQQHLQRRAIAEVLAVLIQHAAVAVVVGVRRQGREPPAGRVSSDKVAIRQLEFRQRLLVLDTPANQLALSGISAR